MTGTPARKVHPSMPPGFLARFGLAAALPLALFASACGGSSSSDKKVDADDWVADLCDIAIDFDKAGDEAGEEFRDADLADTKEAKEAFAKSLDAQEEAVDEFRSEFKKLGQPDIEDGDKVVEAFEQHFDDNDDFTSKLADAVADIDEGDDFVEEFTAIIDDNTEPDFRETLGDVAGDGDDVQALIAEIEDDADCAEVIFDAEEVEDVSDEPTTPATQSARPTTASGTPSTGGGVNQQWVRGVCTSFSGWVGDIQKANTDFQAKIGPAAADPGALKKVMVDFLKIGQAETKNLQREVTALRAPAGNDGPAIHKTFVDTANNLVGVMDDLVADAEKLSTASDAQLAAEIGVLAQGISEAFVEASSGFEELGRLNAPALKDAFNSEPACAGL